LVDVREPDEFAAQRIHGALLHPLSTFEPAALPTDGSRLLVFQCGSGKRSATAARAYMAAGAPRATHLTGGIGAWNAAGLPTIRIDAATGRAVEK
ncbi:MAG TPA: rhodanese-like domain-containing protein, partial [Steroidobacteraceae bacterium]|nr:rhodanese-like domain-containing protein [Steroidobacteraceae bacterium]